MALILVLLLNLSLIYCGLCQQSWVIIVIGIILVTIILLILLHLLLIFLDLFQLLLNSGLCVRIVQTVVGVVGFQDRFAGLLRFMQT